MDKNTAPIVDPQVIEHLARTHGCPRDRARFDWCTLHESRFPSQFDGYCLARVGVWPPLPPNPFGPRSTDPRPGETFVPAWCDVHLVAHVCAYAGSVR